MGFEVGEEEVLAGGEGEGLTEFESFAEFLHFLIVMLFAFFFN